MRASLTALTEELRRLRASGLREISVAPESLERLRVAVRRQKARAPCAESAPNASPPSPSAVAPPSAAQLSPSAVVAPSTPTRAQPPSTAPDDLRSPAASPAAALPAPPSFALPSAGSKAERLAALREIMLGDPVCRAQLRPGKQLVFGVGSPDAQILFVGEAPGGDEERQGEPFVGRAGALLTKMIQAMGLSREQVYIANIMNWRPQLDTLGASGDQVGNRPPTAAEMAYCLPFLKAQLGIVAPQVIVALGATAARGLLGADAFKALGDIRGQWREFSGYPLMVTYHPSYILRNQSNRSKRVIWEDLLKVMERAALPISSKQRSYFLS